MQANLKPANIPPMLLFAIVGSVGFVVDALLLKLFLSFLDVNAITARVLAFPFAVTATWLLNRYYTFSSSKKELPLFIEWLSYVVVNSTGAFFNLLIFSGIIMLFSHAENYPILVLAIASVMAMSVNYFGSKHLVFGQMKPVFIKNKYSQ
jgi:putative flippase GtrA